MKMDITYILGAGNTFLFRFDIDAMVEDELLMATTYLHYLIINKSIAQSCAFTSRQTKADGLQPHTTAER